MDYKIDKIKKYEAKEILNIEYEKYLNDFMDLDAKIDCLVPVTPLLTQTEIVNVDVLVWVVPNALVI